MGTIKLSTVINIALYNKQYNQNQKSTYRVDFVCSTEIVTGADNLASNQAFIRPESASDTADVVWMITI